jgi:hypothetical protein
LKEIGDTIGSHLDQEIVPTVALLRSHKRLGKGGISRDMLVEYLALVAQAALHLCEEMLKDA